MTLSDLQVNKILNQINHNYQNLMQAVIYGEIAKQLLDNNQKAYAQLQAGLHFTPEQLSKLFEEQDLFKQPSDFAKVNLPNLKFDLKVDRPLSPEIQLAVAGLLENLANDTDNKPF